MNRARQLLRRSRLCAALPALVALVAGAASAQAVPTQPPFAQAPSESQRRALTGFPRVDSSVLEARYGVAGEYYDRRRREYVWRLRSAPQGESLEARFVDGGGREVHRAPLVARVLEREADGVAAEAFVAAPAEQRLSEVKSVEVVEAQAP